LVGTNTDFKDYLSLISKYKLKCISNLSPEVIGNFVKEVEKANLNFGEKQKIISFDLNLHEAFIGKHYLTGNYTPKSKINNNRSKNEAIEKFVKNAFNLSTEELNELSEYCCIIDNRLKEVFEHAMTRNCSIMIDAEQSYIQHYFDFLTAHLFRFYNKFECNASTTLQSYLKMHMCRILKWFEFCRENELILGMKLVRGAYLNEERRLAEEGNFPSPVCDSLEETHNNYNDSLKYVFEHLQDKDKV